MESNNCPYSAFHWRRCSRISSRVLGIAQSSTTAVIVDVNRRLHSKPAPGRLMSEIGMLQQLRVGAVAQSMVDIEN